MRVYRGRGGLAHVLDLEEEAHRGGERDALVRGEGERLVVVHHCVHALDPLSIDVSVQHQVLALAPAVEGLGLRVWDDIRFRIWGLELRVQGLGLRVLG